MDGSEHAGALHRPTRRSHKKDEGRFPLAQDGGPPDATMMVPRSKKSSMRGPQSTRHASRARREGPEEPVEGTVRSGAEET